MSPRGRIVATHTVRRPDAFSRPNAAAWFAFLACAFAAALLIVPGPRAQAGELPISVAGFRANVPVESIKERKWSTVVRQQRDFSCGAAAVATLLTYHYGVEADEQVVFEKMFAHGDQATIVREGFSMLDMKRFLAAIGFSADGFRVTLDQLAKERVPAIVVINLQGYLHFVVIKGISDSEVLVGDPALGLRRYDRDEFQQILASDVFFVVRNKASVGRESFNDEESWAALPKAPISEGLEQRAIASLLLSVPGNFGQFPLQ